MPKIIQTNEPSPNDGETKLRHGERVAAEGAAHLRRATAKTMDAARDAGTAAGQTVARAADGNAVAGQNDRWDLVVHTLMEQGCCNGRLVSDLSGLHGRERAVHGHQLYWQDTLARMQRFHDEWRGLSQPAVADRRAAD